MGFWNDATQQAILDTTVAIGGAGGAGYMVGLELARIGVQRFDIADPETFEAANGNRVFGVRAETLGRNKAEVFRSDILAINPQAEVRVYTDGITRDNLIEFMSRADLVLDATELNMPDLGTMVCREGRRRGIPVLNVEYVGHGAQVTSFDPHSSFTFERMMGLDENASLDDIAKQRIDSSRFLAYIPRYGDLTTLMAIRDGAPLPSNMIGAGTAAQLGVAEAVKHIRRRVGQKHVKPTFAPRVRWYDPYSGTSGQTRFPRVSYYRHLAAAVVFNKLGKHEPAAYTEHARALRGDVSEPSEESPQEPT